MAENTPPSPSEWTGRTTEREQGPAKSVNAVNALIIVSAAYADRTLLDPSARLDTATIVKKVAAVTPENINYAPAAKLSDASREKYWDGKDGSFTDHLSAWRESATGWLARQSASETNSDDFIASLGVLDVPEKAVDKQVLMISPPVRDEVANALYEAYLDRRKQTSEDAIQKFARALVRRDKENNDEPITMEELNQRLVAMGGFLGSFGDEIDGVKIADVIRNYVQAEGLVSQIGEEREAINEVVVQMAQQEIVGSARDVLTALSGTSGAAAEEVKPVAVEETDSGIQEATAETESGLVIKMAGTVIPSDKDQDRIGLSSTGKVVVVCDGVSNGFSGGRAAKITVGSFMGMSSSANEEGARQQLHEKALGAQQQLAAFMQETRSDERRKHELPSATTVTAAQVTEDGNLVVAYLGDSVGYEVTSDGRLVKLFEPSMKGPNVPYTIHSDFVYQPYDIAITLTEGGNYLFCTDGLEKLVSQERIAQILNAHKGDPQSATAELRREYLQAKGIEESEPTGRNIDDASFVILTVEKKKEPSAPKESKGAIADTPVEPETSQEDVAPERSMEELRAGVSLYGIPIGWDALQSLGLRVNALSGNPYGKKDFTAIRPPPGVYPALPMVASFLAHESDPQSRIQLPTEEEIKAMKPWLKNVERVTPERWRGKFNQYIEKKGRGIVSDIGTKMVEVTDAIAQIENPQQQFMKEMERFYLSVIQETDSTAEVTVEASIANHIFSLGYLRDGKDSLRFPKANYPLLATLLPVLNVPPPHTDEGTVGIAGAEMMEGIGVFLRQQGFRVPDAPEPISFDPLSLDWFRPNNVMRGLAETFASEKLERVREQLPALLTQVVEVLPRSGPDVATKIYSIAKNIMELQSRGEDPQDIAQLLFAQRDA